MRLWRPAILIVSFAAAGLFVAVSVLLARSFWFREVVEHVAVLERGEPSKLRAHRLASGGGSIFFGVIDCDDDAGIYDGVAPGWRAASARGERMTVPVRRSVSEHLGFFAGSEGGPPLNPWSQRYVIVPYWAVLLVLGGLSAPLGRRVHRRIRARRRAGAGLCVACGYDVRATPHHCPECGAGARQIRARPTSET